MSTWADEGRCYGVFVTIDLAQQLINLIQALERFESDSHSVVAATWYQLDDPFNVETSLRVTHRNDGGWDDYDYHGIILHSSYDLGVPPRQFEEAQDHPVMRPVLLCVDELQQIIDQLRNAKTVDGSRDRITVSDELISEGDGEPRATIDIALVPVLDQWERSNDLAAAFYSIEPGTKNWNDELDLWHGCSLDSRHW